MKQTKEKLHVSNKYGSNDFYPSEWGDFERYIRVPPVLLDKRTPFNDCPHYSDPRFKEAQTVFGQESTGIRDYVYLFHAKKAPGFIHGDELAH